jgi:hypothetical protein
MADRAADALSVKDFGAVGDGVTDDTPAIMAAINAAKDAGGGIVSVPPGVYLHTGINIYRGVRIIGHSSANTVLKNTQGVSVTVDGSGAAGMQYWGLEHVTILQSATTPADHGMEIKDASYGMIVGVVFDSIGGIPQKLEAINYGCFHNQTIGCRFTGCSSASGAINLDGTATRGCNSNQWYGGAIVGGVYGIKIEADGGYGNIFELDIEGQTSALMYLDDGPNEFRGYWEIGAGGTDGIVNRPGAQDNYFKPTVFGFSGSGQRLNDSSGLSYFYFPGAGVGYTEFKGVGLKAGYIFGKTGSSGIDSIVSELTIASSRVSVGSVNAVETDLFLGTLTGKGFVANGNIVRMKVSGDFAANANAKALKCYVGGSLVFSGSTNNNAGGWTVEVETWMETKATSPSLSTIRSRVIVCANDGTINYMRTPASITQTVDSNDDLILKVTGTGVATGDITKRFGSLKWGY